MMNRRSFIAAAPAALIAPVAVSAAEETPVIRAYREIVSLYRSADGYVYSRADGPDVDAAKETLFYDKIGAIEARMMALPCQTPGDFAAKVVVATGEGDFCPDWRSDPLWAEARALIGEA